MNIPSDPSIREFQEVVWDYYAQYGRSMPWREDVTAYAVLVSELMLQQTQVARVIPKFEQFMALFPTIVDLARAPLAEVLIAWQGLGYNRRARFLHEAAKLVAYEYQGVFPDTLEGLVKLPGVGKNTAGALLAYAFDRPSLFIETNIRTILFHHFFEDRPDIDDRELLAVLEATLPSENYRQWYWALMDYGSHLKQTAGGRLDQSRHYKKQPPLKGSLREVRGKIIKELSCAPRDEIGLRTAINADDRFDTALGGLIKDGLVVRKGSVYSLGV